VTWTDGQPRHIWYEQQELCDRARKPKSKSAPEKQKEYHNRYINKMRDEDPERLARIRRAKQLWRYYRMRPEEYDALFEAQGGLCACCGEEPATDVDHCHRGGGVRALLCASCNRMLGQGNDDPLRLLAGAIYLLSQPQRVELPAGRPPVSPRDATRVQR
jgi:hypothetical protein